MSGKGALDARKEAKRARQADAAFRDTQLQQQQLEQAREKRRQIRQARIQRAAVEQTAENRGLAGGSAVAGATSSIQSQLGTNMSFLDQSAQLSSQANAALSTRSSALGAQDAAQGMSTLGMTIFSNANEIASIFNNKSGQ